MVLVFIIDFFEFPLFFFKFSLDFRWMDDSGGGAVWFILLGTDFFSEKLWEVKII